MGQSQSRNKCMGNTHSISDLAIRSYPYWTDDIGERNHLHTNKIPQHNHSTTEFTPNIATPRYPGLPNEIITIIISHLFKQKPKCQKTLQQCTFVSKHCYAVANPLLWRYPILLNDRVAERFLTRLFSTPPQQQRMLGDNIRELDLDTNYWTDDQLLRLLPLVPHLIHLTLTKRANITSEGFEQVPRHCPQLTDLQLVGFTASTRGSLQAIGQYCHQLRVLNLLECHNLPLAYLVLLVGCPLERFAITCHARRTDHETHMMAIKHFELLTDLTIRGTVAPAVIRSLLLLNNNNNTCWPRLTHLHLVAGERIDDTTWIPFVYTHPHLQKIYLTFSTLTDASLDVMAIALPNLTRLVLIQNANVTSKGVLRLVCTGAVRLVKIQLKDCGRLSWRHFPIAASKGGAMPDCICLGRVEMDKIKKNSTNLLNGTTTTTTTR